MFYQIGIEAERLRTQRTSVQLLSGVNPSPSRLLSGLGVNPTVSIQTILPSKGLFTRWTNVRLLSSMGLLVSCQSSSVAERFFTRIANVLRLFFEFER